MYIDPSYSDDPPKITAAGYPLWSCQKTQKTQTKLKTQKTQKIMKNQAKFSGMAVVTAVELSHKAADKNGLLPVMLISVAGTIPNRNVLSGTVADSAGIEVGKTYLVQCTEVEADPTYGRRFNWLKLGEPTLMEVAQAPKTIGKAGIFDVSEVEETEDADNKQVDAKADKTTKAK